jgi:type IV pilus assembly protein PilV
MRAHTFPPAARQHQQGASLIEILIAVLILAIGMLSVGALQATALRNNQSALERSQVVLETYSIIDMMRANVAAARNDAYNMPRTCAAPTGTDRPNVEQAAWINSIHAALGDDACGQIACVASVCTITVEWNDTRGTGGEEFQQLITVARI